MAAGQALFDELVRMKLKGELSATSACVLAHLATTAGACGPCKNLALPRGRQSGSYSRKFDRVIGKPDAIDPFEIRLPASLRDSDERVISKHPMLLPHEILAERYSLHGAVMERNLAEMAFPPTYASHPVVAEAPPARGSASVFPFGVYVDAVAFARDESSIGFWLFDFMTEERWLLTAVRRDDLCNCSCKGWCSFYVIFATIAWSLEAMKSGFYPQRGPEDAEFDPVTDAARAAMGGEPLGCRGCVIAIRADWAELAHTFGLPTWGDGANPCPFCKCDSTNIYNWQGASLLRLPWGRKCSADFEEATRQCEVNVALTDADWKLTRATLMNDWHKDGGRVLCLPLPALGLEARDRLEPSRSVPDTGSGPTGFNLQNPATCVFWRKSQESLVRHRNPMLRQDLGTDVASACAGDWLHTYSLGVLYKWNGFIVWRLVLGNCWGVATSNPKAQAKASLQKLSAEFFQWIRSEERAGRQPTRIQKFKLGMIGKQKNPSMKLYGSQSNTFMKFTGVLLKRHEESLRRVCDIQKAKRAQRCLESWLHVAQLPENSMVMHPAAAQELLDNCKGALLEMKSLGIKPTPKFHQWLHISADTLQKGVPALWGCWEDESLNAVLKLVSNGSRKGPRNKWALRVLNGVNMELRYRCDLTKPMQRGKKRALDT